MKKRSAFLINRWETFSKFPLTHLLLVALTIVSITRIYNGELDLGTLAFSLLFTLLLSFLGPIYLLHKQESNYSSWILWGSQFCALMLGGVFYALYDFSDTVSAVWFFWFGFFLLSALAVPLLIAWILKNNEKKIWLSWTNIFQSLVFGIVAGLLVWGGLSASLKSVELLFDIDLNYKWYEYIGAISMILLAGSLVVNHYVFAIKELPLGDKDIEIESSRIRKIFGVYIFLPLSFVYLLIFLAYGVKILISGIRPKGVLVWLGCGFFVWGLLTLYAIYLEKGKFFEIVRKVVLGSFFFVAIMMAGALLQRVVQYGISINRYLVAMLIFLIVLFSTLGLMYPKSKFRILISLLFGLSLISWYGPLSATNISFLSQKNQLESILLKYNIYLPLASGSLVALQIEDLSRVDQLLRDFEDTYSKSDWNQFFDSPCQEGDLRDIYLCLGLSDFAIENLNVAVSATEYFSVNSEFENSMKIDVLNYSAFYPIAAWREGVKHNTNLYTFSIDGKEYQIDLSNYQKRIKDIADKRFLNIPVLVVDQGEFKFVLTHISGKRASSGNYGVDDFGGYLLVK